jgi:hypothetical protein
MVAHPDIPGIVVNAYPTASTTSSLGAKPRRSVLWVIVCRAELDEAAGAALAAHSGFSSLRRRSNGLVAQQDQMVRGDRSGRVCATVVVGEFHFENAGGEGFDHCSDLAAQQASVGKVASQRDDVEQLHLIVHDTFPQKT